MNRFEVAFIDIDNTIFDHHKKHKFDKKSIKALNNLQENGTKLILCSARPIYSIREFDVLSHIKPDGIISSNGVYRLYRDDWFDRYLFPRNELLEIIKFCKKHRLTVEFVTIDDRFYATKVNEYVELHHKRFYENKAKVEEYTNQDVVAVLLFIPKELDGAMKNKLPSSLLFSRFSDYGVDVITKRHNKGEAVKSMLNYLQIDKKDAIAFGDDYQDISMFDEVGASVALGNAKGEVKENATYITKPVWKHGIYYFLKKNKLIKRRKWHII